MHQMKCQFSTRPDDFEGTIEILRGNHRGMLQKGLANRT